MIVDTQYASLVESIVYSLPAASDVFFRSAFCRYIAALTIAPRPSMKTIVLGICSGVAVPSKPMHLSNKKCSASNESVFPLGSGRTQMATSGRSMEVLITSVWYDTNDGRRDEIRHLQGQVALRRHRELQNIRTILHLDVVLSGACPTW